MKKILGLDLGTNSIGWAVVNEENDVLNKIEAAGSRIIPMDASILGDFAKGNSVSQTAERTGYRGVRRLNERALLRRERLNRVLDVLGFLPIHYSSQLNRYGQIKKGEEPKIAWRENSEGKFEFLFQTSFKEMLAEFKIAQPDMKCVPYDWTIYYLRKKALTEKLAKEELAWLLHNFNQKRGYYQLRGEEEETNKNQLVEFYQLKVVSVEDTGEKKKDETWYNVHLENGMIYRRTSKQPLDWVGKTKDFIVTTELNEDGTPKIANDGTIKRSFRSPKEDDWNLIKIKTEKDINNSNKTIGAYIFDALLQDPSQKVRGKLVRTIERKFYKAELVAILKKQVELQPELFTDQLYKECIEVLYPNNDAHRNNIAKTDFVRLIVEDILFYQRPLKSKKSLISNCAFEVRKDKSGNEHQVKCIAKSNPLFQEFRLWKFVANLKIFDRVNDNVVTAEFLPDENSYVELFEWLNDRKDIKQETLLGSYFKIKKPKGAESLPYRWNYVEDKEYPCNETRGEILTRLKKAGIDQEVATAEFVESLWHVLYSVEDKIEIEKALAKFARKHNLPIEFVESFKKCKPFKKDYGSYSEKAIKKLLALMRMGKYWSEDAIDENTKERISKIINGEYDETIREKVRKLAIELGDIPCFKALPEWFACYVVYNRHSEAKDICKWKEPKDIDNYLKTFKQHSMRNPIVEQVVTETLRTVRDIWKQVGQIDEIHIELGRDLKNPADVRKRMTTQITEKENANERIKALLAEFVNPEYGIEGVKPYSPSQQEILKIYEEGALLGLAKNDDEYEFITRVSKAPTISKSDVTKYKCWLEQHYRSPYTGEMISLSRLFTSDYEIEHVIPQSRYFDDSLSNKVICEAAVNKLKTNMLGHEFIKKHHGEKVFIGGEKYVTIFEIEDYEQFVKDMYAKNPSKRKKLMLDDVPEEFSNRQLNDSRYISKEVMALLSNIVREDGEETANSTNVIPCNGTITDRLKHDWGMDNVWNSIVLPRFERMNQITGKDCFTAKTAEGHIIPAMPQELQKGFNKKRIDHRHHAMDAITIACCSRSMVQYFSTVNSQSENKSQKIALAKNLCNFETKTYTTKEQNSNGVWVDGKSVTREVPTSIKLPWDSFPQDAKEMLESIVVSFKQNLRVINRTTNYTEKLVNGKKVFEKQTKGDSWAIRKPMHKETVFAKVNLKKEKVVAINYILKNDDVELAKAEGYNPLTVEQKVNAIINKDLKLKLKELIAEGKNDKQIKKYFEEDKEAWSDVNLKKIPMYYYSEDTKNEHYFATRKVVDESFTEDVIKNSVTDTGAQKILLNHLAQNDKRPEVAFSPDGIDKMNLNIVALNDGVAHQPIRKVRKYEQAEKFKVGDKGNKKDKYVEAAKGTNLFFAIYDNVSTNEMGEEVHTRSFETIPLNVAISRQKKGLSAVPETDENGNILLFYLSPNDLVYVPLEKNSNNELVANSIYNDRLYKMVSCTGNEGHFVPIAVAFPILQTTELGSNNKAQRAWTNEMIKEVCLPVSVDRLGNIIKIG